MMMYKGKSMDAQNIKDKDIIKNEVKDLWNKHKLLLIIIIPCLLIIILALSAAVVQKALKEEGIEAGIGTNSNILAAIGRSKAESAESVSFSLKAGTTMEDADKIVDSLKEIVTGERTVL